jgi:outer membrane lipopolysaccharide assembly protein LptE/RlpB
MLKKIFTLILFLFLSACGYEAIHSKKNSINYDFAISELTFIGDRHVNLKIKKKLNNYTLTKKDKNFKLSISSATEKSVLAKNASGDPTSFKSTIIINVEVFIKNNLRNNLQITENFNYKNNSNKFDLKRYEMEIRNNLAEIAADKLIFKLSNIQ